MVLTLILVSRLLLCFLLWLETRLISGHRLCEIAYNKGQPSMLTTNTGVSKVPR